GQGLEAYITQQFESLGSNTVIIAPGDVFGENGGFNAQGRISALGQNILTLDELQEVKKVREFVKLAAPVTNNNEQIGFQQNQENGTVVGTSYNYSKIRNTELAKGRFFNQNEENGDEKVAVLGWEIAQELFGQIDPVGKKVKLGTQSYQVVGVADKVGSGFGGPNLDNYVYIPFGSAMKLFDRDDLTQILVQTYNNEQIDEAITALENQLLENLEEDEFSVFDQRQILDVINDILGILTVALGGIGGISLLVGGIGIMNIMLVSVAERTNEIGLRKAIGATPSQILIQFLIEAAVLSLLGGLIGLILAFAGSLAIQLIFPAKVTYQAVALAFGVSTAIGLIFGVAPARRAAKLSPIETLRYE
ncbi:MAG: FtsX-like permease family protein, partial [Candidatus Pacebacteria bacterium]|nr:FtsX-like permease family protein [Candidatus Paceibacterota bacterium]